MDLRAYVLVTIAYWAFTITDGALRMLVVLHFHEHGFTAIQIAFLLLFYELAGVITNAVGGWLATRFGLRWTLLVGLATQIGALSGLALLDTSWPLVTQIIFVMAMQMFSGVAKDLTKMSSKSAIKLVVPEDAPDAQKSLFKWVAILTGSKNALKGVGFFLGGVLLTSIGFTLSLWSMAAALVMTLLSSWLLLPANMGQAKTKKSFTQLFANSRGLNMLAAARLFLFAARDVWFVVGVPVFCATSLQWNHAQIGTFLALWVIGYGIVQGLAPAVLRRWCGDSAPGPRAALALVAVLTACTAAIPFVLNTFNPAIVLIVGLGIFGALFALNSSVHSYLVLAYSERDSVAANVGFYYMANAGGRVLGTMASGLLAWQYGVHGCLWGSVACLTIAIALTAMMPPPDTAVE